MSLLLDYLNINEHSAPLSGPLRGENLSLLWLAIYLVAISSSCLNPILYGLLNRNFNQELSNMFSAIRLSSRATTLPTVVAAKSTGDSIGLTDRNISTNRDKNSPNPTPFTNATQAAPVISQSDSF